MGIGIGFLILSIVLFGLAIAASVAITNNKFRGGPVSKETQTSMTILAWIMVVLAAFPGYGTVFALVPCSVWLFVK
jgi:hypothetical protein